MSFTPKFPFFSTIDIYIIRNNILSHIKKSRKYFVGSMLDVGCGHMPYKEIITHDNSGVKYIGLDLYNSDIYNQVTPDLLWDGCNIPLDNESIDSVLLTEVLEHCPEPDKVLAEVFRVLKPNAPVVFTVPHLWYLHESPWDFYRYTPFAIKKLLEDKGFSIEQLEIYGSNDLAFLHTYFIWLKKSALPKLIRFLIYVLTLPFILIFLLFAKQKNRSDFHDGNFFIGIVGVAKKKK